MPAHTELAAIDKRKNVDAGMMVKALRCAGIDHHDEIATADGCRGPITIDKRYELLRVGLDCAEHGSELGLSDWS